MLCKFIDTDLLLAYTLVCRLQLCAVRIGGIGKRFPALSRSVGNVLGAIAVPADFGAVPNVGGPIQSVGSCSIYCLVGNDWSY